MLRSINDIIGYHLQCTDGEVGTCKDFLFDDRQRTIRYVVVDTGAWLPGQKVLLSPVLLGTPDWKSRRLFVKTTTKEVENAPPLESDMPVSLTYEKQLMAHYDFPYYWVGNRGPWGMAGYPAMLMNAPKNHERESSAEEIREPDEDHLRAAKEVVGYNIGTLDEDIGHVEDMIVNDETWVIRYIVVDTRNWLPGGKKVLVSSSWITDVSWKHAKVNLNLKSRAVKDGPEYDPGMPINRVYEMRLYDFHGKPYDW